MTGRREVLGAVVLLAAVLAAMAHPLARHASAAERRPVHEDELKAAFVFNFGRFVEWPESAFEGATAPLVVCTLEAEFAPALEDALAGKSLHDRPVQTRTVETDEDIAACHILFVGSDQQSRWTAMRPVLGGRHILTVGETRAFCRADGVIGLFLTDGRLRFDINVDAAERRGLVISSQLLKLAATVHRAENER